MTVEVLDWRARQPNPPKLVRGKKKHRLDAHGLVVVRNIGDIDSITVHQTACTFGKAKGDPDRYHRAFGVACHALAFSDRRVVLPNPLLWHVNHGNGFNARALGLEIEGRFPGLKGKPGTLASTPETPVTEDLVETAREALRQLVELGRGLGMPIRYAHAHRQSSPTRRSDPGEELWRRVVLEYGVPELGLVTQPQLVLLTGRPPEPGRPIPLAWDPQGVGKY